MKYTPYSFSKIDLFNKCPYAWKLAYIERLKPERHPSMELGSLVHSIIAEYLCLLKDRGEPTNHSLLDQVVAKHAGEVHEEIVPFLSAIKEIVIPPGVVPQIEVELAVDEQFSACAYDSARAFLRGKVDYTYTLMDTVVVIDWKTSHILPSEEVIHRDWQTRFYAVLMDAIVPPQVENFVIELNYLRHRKVRKLKISRESLDEVKEWIIANIKKIESEKKFEPTPGEWCSWCGYQAMCPVVKPVLHSTSGSVIPEKITTRSDAIRLTGMLKVLDQVRERIQKLLKEWVAENGAVHLSGEVLDFHQVETFRWETPEQKAALAAALLEAGVERKDVWQVFTTNKSAVCSFAKKHGLKDRLEHILATGEKHTYQRFGFKKKA